MAVSDGDGLRAAIQELVDYAAGRGMLAWADRIWAYNTVLGCTGVTGPGPDETWALEDGPRDGDGGARRGGEPFDLEATLAILSGAAVANGVAEDTTSGRDRIAMRVMGELMPRPSEVARAFDALRATEGPRAATDAFYRLCCDAGYVRRAAIARNVKWRTPTRWGDLEITINLSKPEKDPREIAAAGAAPADGKKYPACQLCIENEGYPGRGAAAAGGAHPARQNLRIVPIELGGERWGLQYSPYAYYGEHCIAMSSRHRPMHVDARTLGCLLDFVDLLPHYFVGSNADLPIVGGSILAHDHFQGGAHEFPMMRARTARTFDIAGHPRVSCEVLEWPLSVLRLRAASREDLAKAASHVIDAWRGYSDASVGVVARTEDGVPHNTVTPVVRRVDGDGGIGGTTYEAYLALRCNATSAEHPLGVFHPHAEYHHIKRENIGLIEVMGLAILPGRLVRELACVRGELLEAARDDRDGEWLQKRLEARGDGRAHATWAAEVLDRRRTELVAADEEAATALLREEVGHVFGHVLEDAGVFKWDGEGRAAQDRFLDAL